MEIVYEAVLLDQAPPGLSYEQETDWLRRWANHNNYLIYTRLREDYCEVEAIRLAKEGGYRGVMADCLS